MYTTSIAFKKKWKPARRETLNQKRELTFEPKERNRRVYSEIRRRVWESGTEKKKMLSTDLGISLYRDPVQTSPNVRCKEHPYTLPHPVKIKHVWKGNERKKRKEKKKKIIHKSI